MNRKLYTTVHQLAAFRAAMDVVLEWLQPSVRDVWVQRGGPPAAIDECVKEVQ
jgi:hypothetical protein